MELLGQLFTRLSPQKCLIPAVLRQWRWLGGCVTAILLQEAESVLCPGPVFVSRKLDMRMPCGQGSSLPKKQLVV